MEGESDTTWTSFGKIRKILPTKSPNGEKRKGASPEAKNPKDRLY